MPSFLHRDRNSGPDAVAQWYKSGGDTVVSIESASSKELKNETATPQRILFITEGGLGDHVTLTPAIRELKQSFPTSFIAMFATYRQPTDISKKNPFIDLYPSETEREHSVFSTNKNIDEFYILNRYAFKSLPLLSRIGAEWSVIRFLRSKKFDTVISTFPHKERFILWALVSGAANRVGAKNQGLHWLLTHAPDIEKTRTGVVEYYCDLVRAIGATVRSTRTEYRVPDVSLRWADQLLQQLRVQSSEKIVAVHPGASGFYKVWPPERYAALIDLINAKWNVTVLVLKGENDGAVTSAIRKNLRSEVKEVDCSGAIGNLAALFQRSVLCISNDSGPRHVAVAVRTPSLALFRQCHDREWDMYGGDANCITLKGNEECPVCPPTQCLDKVPEGEHYGSHCLRMVSVENAISHVDRMLRVGGAERKVGGFTKLTSYPK